MNKKDLIKKIVSNHTELSIRKTQIIVDCLIENISLALKKGEKVTLRNFGAFYNSNTSVNFYR